MSKTRFDKYPALVLSLLVLASLWFLVVIAWSGSIIFALNKKTTLEPVSSNVQQQVIQNAIELFSSLSVEE
jgi:hypothetical protein